MHACMQPNGQELTLSRTEYSISGTAYLFTSLMHHQTTFSKIVLTGIGAINVTQFGMNKWYHLQQVNIYMFYPTSYGNILILLLLFLLLYIYISIFIYLLYMK